MRVSDRLGTVVLVFVQASNLQMWYFMIVVLKIWSRIKHIKILSLKHLHHESSRELVTSRSPAAGGVVTLKHLEKRVRGVAGVE